MCKIDFAGYCQKYDGLALGANICFGEKSMASSHSPFRITQHYTTKIIMALVFKIQEVFSASFYLVLEIGIGNRVNSFNTQ